MRPGTAVQSHMGRYAGSVFAVARSLVHARGGELSAANSQQGGAVLCLSLLLAQAPAASGQAAGNRSPGAAFEVAPRMALAGWCWMALAGWCWAVVAGWCWLAGAGLWWHYLS